MKAQSIALALTAILTVWSAAPASAATIALDFTGGDPEGYCGEEAVTGCTVGWAFEVTTPLTLVGLGVWDASSDGFLEAGHAVGIFDSTGTLITSTTITNTSTAIAGASPAGRWLTENVEAIVLTPGDYEIGAFFGPLDPPSADHIAFDATAFTQPGVIYGGARLGFGVALTNPSPTQSRFEDGLFGPTFLTEATVVPEPSTLTLILAGSAIAARRRLKSRRD